MADLSEEIRLELNVDELLRDLEGVNIEAEKTVAKVQTVKEVSKLSFNQTMGAVHAGWLAVQGLVRMGGGSIQTVFRTVIGTTLGAISTLQPVLHAALQGGLASMNPWMVAQAALGLISIGTSIAALMAFQSEEKALSDALRGANMAMHGVQSVIGFVPTM